MLRLLSFGLGVGGLLLLGCSEPKPTSASDNQADPMLRQAATAQRSAVEIVNQHCLVCHARGLYNAPKIGDVSAWQPRLAAGPERLWQVVLQGQRAMPPRGGCHDCSELELRAAMEHLLALTPLTSAETDPAVTVSP